NAEGETSRQPSPEREPFELPRAYAHQLSRLAPYRTRRPRHSARAHRVRCYKDSPRSRRWSAKRARHLDAIASRGVAIKQPLLPRPRIRDTEVEIMQSQHGCDEIRGSAREGEGESGDAGLPGTGNLQVEWQ